MFSKRKKLGKTLKELQEGSSVSKEFEINDKDILLYLGFSDDANPIYIQHDYASRTPYERPIVPQLMLIGFVTSLISTGLPGPGSVIREQQLAFPKPLYHYGKLTLTLTVEKLNTEKGTALMTVDGRDEYNDSIILGTMDVTPPYPWKPMTEQAGTFENF
ncbi:MaoC/PaaZ C-terminal domain-containing protein [Bacillus daqingensis]|uniref:MaoC/PaaZ C-terminal domain-containing protein n=1 Tax=Bacillus daqingensis TaxID=872396 RepID=A0ABV9NYV7_9BACI